MNIKTLTRNTNERGYTLMEILVAVAIFGIVILVALLLYDRSNQVFKQSVESSDMQQSTRVAFDKLAADLRMAGFDYDRDGTPFSALASTWKAETAYTAGMLVQPTNPNGHTYLCVNGGTSFKTEPTWPVTENDQVAESGGSTVKWQEKGQLQYQQPDEQIEYAGRSAVVLRANFNYGTATGACTGLTPCEGGREPKYQTAEFPVVTIANNEIVAYALKPVKWAAGETADDLVFYADVAIPRNANPSTDGKESKITITGVDLCDKGGCNSPPYTLYRYTIQDNGQPDAGVPVAENIRDLQLKYFTTTSAATADEITTLPNGDGQYDGGLPDAIVAGRDTRSSIRAVELSLTGMNPQPDYNYTNPSDTIAKNYRTLELKSLITPRNAGRRGMKEYNTDAPGVPEIKSICSGACNAVFLTWSPPSVGGDIESYAILYDTDKCQGDDMPLGGYQYSEEVGLNLSGSVGRYIVPGTEYSFAVQAISKWGAKQSKCVGPIKAINKTKPAALKELIATHTTYVSPSPYAAVSNQIDLYFTPALANVDGQNELSCTGGGNVAETEMPPAEKRYYEVWRGPKETFQPGDSDAKLILEAGSTIQPAQIGDYMKFSDLTAANCTDYYYRIRVVDYCARNAAYNDSGSKSQGESDWYPALGDNAIPGYATTKYDPKPPVLTMEKANCASGTCTLTFSWGAVNQNTNGDTIAVDEYTLKVYKSLDGSTFPSTVTDTKTVNGVLTTTYDMKDTDLAKFTLVAKDCSESAASNEVVYPCVFNAGALVAGVSAGSFGGTGTSVDPYIIEGATATATTTNKVSQFRMAVFDATDGSQFATDSQSGSINTASFAIPNTPDGRMMRVLITAIDDKGCSKNTDFYVSDTAPPLCSITDSGSDSSIITINKTNVVFTLKNPSTNDLTVKKVVVKFNAATGKELESVGFNGTTVLSNCTKTTVVVTAPSGSVIGKGTSSYKLQVNYTDNNLQGANPTTSLCIIYQTPAGDILSCQMHPSAATCTEPAGTCQ